MTLHADEDEARRALAAAAEDAPTPHVRIERIRRAARRATAVRAGAVVAVVAALLAVAVPALFSAGHTRPAPAAVADHRSPGGFEIPVRGTIEVRTITELDDLRGGSCRPGWLVDPDHRGCWQAGPVLFRTTGGARLSEPYSRAFHSPYLVVTLSSGDRARLEQATSKLLGGQEVAVLVNGTMVSYSFVQQDAWPDVQLGFPPGVDLIKTMQLLLRAPS